MGVWLYKPYYMFFNLSNRKMKEAITVRALPLIKEMLLFRTEWL